MKTTNSNIDPFHVPQQPHFLKQMCIFMLMLPVSITSLSLFILLALPFVLVYHSLSITLKHAVSKWFSFWVLLTLRFRLRVDDQSKTKQHRIIVANHISIIDSIAFFHYFGHVHMLAAAFTRNHPIFGILSRAIDPIFVDKSKKGHTLKELRDSYKKSPFPTLIFSEGVFSNGTGLLKFQRGAFVLGEPITPTLLQYTDPIPYWNRQESSFLTQLFRILSKIYTPVHLTIFPEYHPTNEEIEQPEIFAYNVRQFLADKGNLYMHDVDYKSSPNHAKDSKGNRNA